MRPVSVQAEDPGNALVAGARIASCATCDGGGRVRYLGGANQLVAYMDVPIAGTRTVTVAYEVDGTRTLKVAIGGVVALVRTVTGTGWETPLVLQFTAVVPAGRVSLTFYNDTSGAPDMDMVTVS
jgi:hypothetical protein